MAYTIPNTAVRIYPTSTRQGSADDYTNFQTEHNGASVLWKAVEPVLIASGLDGYLITQGEYDADADEWYLDGDEPFEFMLQGYYFRFDKLSDMVTYAQTSTAGSDVTSFCELTYNNLKVTATIRVHTQTYSSVGGTESFKVLSGKDSTTGDDGDLSGETSETFSLELFWYDDGKYIPCSESCIRSYLMVDDGEI